MTAIHEKYMRRALQLARNGVPYAVPNPFVGAVIVSADGRVIGEGYHRRCGQAHAEVNAVASVAPGENLADSTMYVTLEPCAHYGRTPPCARLVIDRHIPRVVVGTRDPFGKVDGKGIEMMREAGVDVTVGVLEDECRSLNAMFFTAHTLQRPFVLLKWAQSADGFLDRVRRGHCRAASISDGLTRMLVHAWRAVCGAIIVGSGTVLADDPALDTRLWPGPSPMPVVLDRRGRLAAEDAPQLRIFGRDPLIVNDRKPLSDILGDLYRRGIISVMVEGGPTLLQSFIDAGLWDLARVETSPVRFGNAGCAPAPVFTTGTGCPARNIQAGANIIGYYLNNRLVDVKNI